jgi:3-hydroxyacyl-CoA dehydrogenase/enoyl-CoA hydratase/3-hydroxybutyryl-CoA epimerase
MESLVPPDAPPAGSCVRVERPESGLAVVILDPPHKKFALLDLPLMRDLDAVLEKLAREVDLKGVVLTGRSPTSFAAGADLDALARLEQPNIAVELARFGQGVFNRLAGLRATTVAAVGGPVPGGAYEVSLACDRIVLADHPSSRIGLPETRLGILPGWGGSQRLPRRIGVPAALDAILNGRLYDPRRAKRMGLVDRLAVPEYLLRIAGDIAMGRQRCAPRRRGAALWLVDKNPAALAVIGRKVQRDLLAKTGGHYPAPVAALDLVLKAPSTPFATGFDREAQALGKLAVSPECKSLVSIFRLSEDAKKLGKLPDGSEAAVIERAGVIGAGVMGAGIASLCAERGLNVRLSDIARDPLDRALIAHRAGIAKLRKQRRLQQHEADAASDRLTVSTTLQGFGASGIVIEAVAERIEVKHQVLGRIAEQIGPDAILATNTSSLSVDAIAERLPHPERVVGMHFFNPVPKMPLVEVVRGTQTSEAVVRATAKLALKLGKTPVITSDSPGFLVNRLLGPYLDEAARLFEAGVEIERIDRVVRDFGMPMGPLELLDEVGFDIAAHAAESLGAAFGERMACSPVLANLLEADLKGKKTGAGFYLHDRGKGPKLPNPEVKRFVDSRAAQQADFSDQVILDYLLMAMLNEAAFALTEGVVDGPREVDLATVFGMGFPPFRGGLLRWADSLGPRDVLDRLARIAGAPDVLARPVGSARFKPAPMLQDLARASGV